MASIQQWLNGAGKSGVIKQRHHKPHLANGISAGENNGGEIAYGGFGIIGGAYGSSVININNQYNIGVTS